MSVGKRLRFEILKRDGFTCRYCGKDASAAELHVDHIKPRALGGADDPSNLVTACKACNGGKSCVPLSVLNVAEHPADVVVDNALADASIAAKDVLARRRRRRALEEEQEIDDAAGWIEIAFPMGLPDGFM